MEKSTSTVLRGGDDGNVIPLTRPWKKRFRYGTLLVDLERHQIVDVLLDRDDRTFAHWLTHHPEVEVVSRDRATDYAKAAREAAPQA